LAAFLDDEKNIRIDERASKRSQKRLGGRAGGLLCRVEQAIGGVVELPSGRLIEEDRPELGRVEAVNLLPYR
jgi:hypothetical protein